jgi:hypothetical protein
MLCTVIGVGLLQDGLAAQVVEPAAGGDEAQVGQGVEVLGPAADLLRGDDVVESGDVDGDACNPTPGAAVDELVVADSLSVAVGDRGG